MPETPSPSEHTAEPENSSPRIRVAIIDDHVMVADGFARIVSAEEDLEFVGIAANVAESLALVERAHPDVVLMDYRLPDGDGAEATRRILTRFPETKVVMLSGVGGHELIARAIESGCAGFISKDRPGSDIIAAVRSAWNGESVLRADDLAELLGRLRSSPNEQARWLSVRELEVLRLLAKGHSTERIAEELFLSPHTVRNHVANVLVKLGAHSKLEAVAIAARDGVLGLDEVG